MDTLTGYTKRHSSLVVSCNKEGLSSYSIIQDVVKDPLVIWWWTALRSIMSLGLTGWGAFSRRNTLANCVASGSVLMKEYEGARVGVGNMDTLVKGSASTRYWTRSVTSSCEPALISIFTVDQGRAFITIGPRDSHRHSSSSAASSTSYKSHRKHSTSSTILHPNLQRDDGHDHSSRCRLHDSDIVLLRYHLEILLMLKSKEEEEWWWE